MKYQENNIVLLLHSCLQIDEASRRAWTARNTTQLAERLRQLVPGECADVSRLSAYLQRRRRALCWCLLLLGGRVDVQLQPLAELFATCGGNPRAAAFLRQHAAELAQQQHLYTIYQQQQQQQLQLVGQAVISAGAVDVAVTPGLLPDEGGGGGGGGGDRRPPELSRYCTERLAALLGCVDREPDSTDFVVHLALRRNGAPLACLVRMLAGAAPAAAASAAADAGGGGSPGASSGDGGGGTSSLGLGLAACAARALSYLSAFTDLRGPLLAAGAVPPLLGCLAAAAAAVGGIRPLSPPPPPPHHHRQQPKTASPSPARVAQQLAADAAQCLANLSTSEAAGREMLRVPGPTGFQALIALLGGGAGGAAVEPAVHALAALSAHPTLRPGLVAAGATEALSSLVERSGGPLLAAWALRPPPPLPPLAGVGGGAAAPMSAAPQATMELALLALVRCIRSYSSGGVAGSELPAAALQLLLDVAAMPTQATAEARVSTAAPPSPPSPPRDSPPSPSAARLSLRQLSLRSLSSSSPTKEEKLDGDGGGDGQPQQQPPAPPMVTIVVVEATEALADMARDTAGALRLMDVAGHLVLMTRLLASMPTTATAPPSSPASSPPLPPAPPSLDPFARRQLDACMRGLARLSLAAPSHPDLRSARTHEALLTAMLALGLADKPGWWALQGLCALAADAGCASDLVAAGVLPPVVAALRGLAASLNLEKHRTSGGGGGGGGAAAAASDRDMEVAHLLGLLLQNLAGHKAVAGMAVSEGAVPAICEWLAVCAARDDVEGCVLGCAALCLLGDGDVGALVDIVHANGVDTLVELMHPRWATAALVPSTVAAALAVACRWPASAQAVRMAAGIPALADTLRGPHGLACCRPVVAALIELIANDPPALREIRTTNTVIALGTQLQLLPNNDPRAARIRLLLRQLGEDPDTAMRLANSEADVAAAAAAAAPHHQLHPLLHNHNQHQHPGKGSAAAAGGGGGGGGLLHPNPSARRLQLQAEAATTAAGGGSWRWRFARFSESGPSPPPPPAATPPPQSLGALGGRRSWRVSSPGAIVPEEEGHRGGGGVAGATAGPAAAAAAAGVRWRCSPREDLDSVLAALRGESSYKSLRRASLKQLAKRMDASDFSDVEDDVEDYMAVLEVASRDQAGAAAPLSRSTSRRQTPPPPPPPPASVASTASQQVASSRSASAAPGTSSPVASSASASADVAAVSATAAALLAPAAAAAECPAADCVVEGKAKGAGPAAATSTVPSGGGGGGDGCGAATRFPVTPVSAAADAGAAAGQPLSPCGPPPLVTALPNFPSSMQQQGDQDAEQQRQPRSPPPPHPKRDQQQQQQKQQQQQQQQQQQHDGCGVDGRQGGDGGDGNSDPTATALRPAHHSTSSVHQRQEQQQQQPQQDVHNADTLEIGSHGGTPISTHHQHRYSGADGCGDFWLGAHDSAIGLDNNINYQLPSTAQSSLLPPPQDGDQPSRDHPYYNNQQRLHGNRHSGRNNNHQLQDPNPSWHQQQQQPEELTLPFERPVSHRGRNPVINTLQAVNPMRLFGAIRRGHRRGRGGAGDNDGDDGVDSGGGSGGSDRRRSLQVDGEELVFWSAGDAEL